MHLWYNTTGSVVPLWHTQTHRGPAALASCRWSPSRPVLLASGSGPTETDPVVSLPAAHIYRFTPRWGDLLPRVTCKSDLQKKRLFWFNKRFVNQVFTIPTFSSFNGAIDWLWLVLGFSSARQCFIFLSLRVAFIGLFWETEHVPVCVFFFCLLYD